MHHPRPLTLTAGLALAASLAACGDDSPMQAGAGPGVEPVAPAALTPARAGAGEAGRYRARLTVLNARAQNGLDPDARDGALGVARGWAEFTVTASSFDAAVHALGAEPGMIHPQHVHSADRCPPASADVNHDGFVDVIEGVPFYGPILIPLDDDLASQAAGAFPAASGRRGALDYRSSTSFGALLGELNAPDPDPTDAVVKLGGAPLALETRHVVLHGVDPSTPLPPSVASLPGLPAYLTLPVACGEITRVR